MQITPAAEKYLSERTNMVLATIRKDGRPQLSPVWFIWQDGEFLISTTPSTAKWKNLLRDQRCTGVVDAPNGRYISVSGVAEMWTEVAPHEVSTEIVRKYKLGDEFEPYMDTLRKERPVRGIIRLKPESIVHSGFD
ncbi:PPOX class F420-dependent oxidoreductase [Candidatus Lucifugimonas marina]|uniref:TIGR03618 family F420-dependent PPOX class oxidoreductase n=1 Tax=Candidatus Lucifugimonas marina TaxID=3038979 RepID=A0AAJ5ZC54_9CHLR|nr:TIGR03618 family F420-dependent PPOX class oxidoreductase [SAR202 cluster bacterium JH702]MDG0869628.1 TIGR03618 family F420-dependent PPOX class oxidoreductase [SAR202 cluster bacterium JH639]WFG34361.1 TIGR03618 family F420-dependent PPOX class oxidoreductase [SAR202 cluster bacterium JH545]WFG38290.1 TIGR03618 family F420-dependent PPOX class oxidoreductase [SAR202 cluster bacterium JH1073]